MNIFVFVKQIPVISDIQMNHQTFTDSFEYRK